MKKAILFFLWLTAGYVVKAQTATDSVKAVINQLFTAMRNADSTSVVNCFAEKHTLQTLVRNKDGNMYSKTDQVTDFGHNIARLQKNAADERIEFASINIDGPLASVWTPYKFYFNGNFSHCGANSFQLLRTKNGWKILYLVDTRRKEPCEK
ncbi:MAG: hypothetical protein ACOYVG_02325 [Bacteroidota bacterium]